MRQLAADALKRGLAPTVPVAGPAARLLGVVLAVLVAMKGVRDDPDGGRKRGQVHIRLVPGPVRIVPARWFTNPRMSNLQILGPVVYYFSKAGVVHA